MNWTWNIRSRDGAMNVLEFARCTTAGGFNRVLIHAAPAQAQIEIIAEDDRVIVRGDLDRHGEYSPMTLVELDGPHCAEARCGPPTTSMGCPCCLLAGKSAYSRSGTMPRTAVGGSGPSSSPTTLAVQPIGRR